MRLHWNHWFMIVIGGWLIISPWLLGFYKLNLVVWNVILSGVGIIFIALWDALLKTEEK